MNEGINICKILKDCKAGTNLYSPIFGKVELKQLYPGKFWCIETNNACLYTNDGKIAIHDGVGKLSDECMLFPSKSQRDWENTHLFDKNRLSHSDMLDIVYRTDLEQCLVRNRGDVWHYAEGLHSIRTLDGIKNFLDRFFVNRDPTSARRSDKGELYEQVIPYNDDTKSLIGTADDCAEYYKWWEE